MIVRPTTVALFAGCGVATLVVLVSLGSRTSWEGLDRHTGRELSSGAELLDEALATGSASEALEILVGAGGVAGPEEIRSATAVLTHELAALGALPPTLHPSWEEIREAAIARESVRAELRSMAPSVSDDVVLPLVREMLVDGLQAVAVEGLFSTFSNSRGVDARAAHAAAERDLSAAACLELAADFRAEKRGRAELRWLLRAFDRDPAAAADDLGAALVATGELEAALRVVSSTPDARPSTLRRHIEYTAWLGDHDEEACALERLAAAGGCSAEELSRLVDLHVFRGAPDRALPHAASLAGIVDSRPSQQLPVSLAMQAGEVDVALALLDERVAAGDPDGHWTDLRLSVLEQDQRFDRLERELERLWRMAPSVYEDRYEEVLRRRWRLAPLLRLVERRSNAAPELDDLSNEALALALQLGDHAAVARLVERDFAPDGRAVRALRRLPVLASLGVERPRARLLELLPRASFERADALAAFRALERRAPDGELLTAVEAASGRHLGARSVHRARLAVLDALDPERALSVAREAALAHPGDAEFARAWVDRAKWAGTRGDSTMALAHAVTRSPEDEALRAELADALTDAREGARALELWRGLLRDAADDAPEPWIEGALAAAAMLPEPEPLADLWQRYLEQRSAPLARAANVGERLFRVERLGAAAPFFAHVLDRIPDEPRSLLRLGQCRSWLGDPRGALAPLETLHALPMGRELEARFLLAEARSAAGGAARPLYEEVVRRIRPDDPLPERQLWLGRSLLRLGRVDEGLDVVERLVRGATPEDVRRLDLADAYLAAGDRDRALAAVEPFVAARPDDPRGHRMLGRTRLEAGDSQGAIESLVEALTLGGAGDGVGTDLALAYESNGQWRSAAGAASAAIEARPDDPAVRAVDQDLRERLSSLGGALLRLRAIADDRETTLGVFGSILLDDEWTRLLLAVEMGDYSGRSAAVGAGDVDVEEDVTSVRVALDQRHAVDRAWAAGLHLFPDAPGGGRVGAWGAYRWREAGERSWQVDARLGAGELWTEVPAAVGLGGRRTGLEVEAFRSLEGPWWISGGAHHAELSLDSEETGDVSDWRSGLRVSVGKLLTQDAPQVAEPTRFDRIGALGFSPYLEDEVGHTQTQVYAGLDAQWLGDGAELANLLPLRDESTYLLLGGRVDRTLRPGLGGMLEATVGVELAEGEPAASLDGGLTWRPSFGLEVLARAGVGQALGRSATDTEVRLLLGIQIRR